jgi:hypothetical protein
VQIALVGEQLALRFDVRDARITPARQDWDGCTVELYTRAVEEEPIHQLVLAPKGAGNPTATQLYRGGEAAEDATPVRSNLGLLPGQGYRLTILVPMETLGVGIAATSFTMEAAITATRRLNKPPSWLSLFGSFGAFRDSSRYAVVKVER